MNAKARSRKGGFTLAEVLIASAGVALGAVGILVAFSVLTRTARVMNTQASALHLARQQIEQLRTCSFSDAALSMGTHSISGGTYLVTNYIYANTRRVTVSLNVTGPDNRTSQVTVSTVMSSAFHK